MMADLTLSEKKALELMQKDNFRGISKGNVMQLMSIIDKVDPEVAKAIIAQLPEVVQGIVEAEQLYAGLLDKGMEVCERSTTSCFATEDDLISSLKEELSKEGTNFEEKKYFYEKIEAAAIRKEAKDTEHRNTILSILKYGGEALAIGLAVTVSIFIGKADMTLPLKKAA